MKIALVLFSFLLALPLWAQMPESLGIIDGKSVQIQDIEDHELNDLRKKLYEKIDQQFQQAALQQLWSSGKLTQPKPKQVSDSEIKAFYNANQLSQRGSLAEFSPRIKQHLESLSLMQAAQTQYDSAIKKGWIKPYFTAPNDFTLSVPLSTGYSWKASQPKVMILEFSDYQCPFCSRVQDSLNKLRKKYSKEVIFAYRHLPLPFHENADDAANAVECAREQGQFEAYHHLLFENQKALSNPDLIAYGKQVQVKNQKQFNSCVQNFKYKAQVQADTQYAQSIGLNGTPSFVIGRYDEKSKTVRGEMISGAQPLEAFESLIQKYLK